ncbi:hypothetical protein CEXT_213971 [Caerostris extrusa]|uniref:Uncharacterized protein n=1 Tax=Caerostris extrusa TaxID=172846 RepID=A0AAV4MF55_CAEEX|nr:hypothetical protein CEXT_213971 [Caerostris extrusa]
MHQTSSKSIFKNPCCSRIKKTTGLSEDCLQTCSLLKSFGESAPSDRKIFSGLVRTVCKLVPSSRALEKVPRATGKSFHFAESPPGDGEIFLFCREFPPRQGTWRK